MTKPSPRSREAKELKDFDPNWNCRFHPVDWFHEFGCPHQEWTKEQLQEALNNAKRSNAYLVYLLGEPLNLKGRGKKGTLY